MQEEFVCNGAGRYLCQLNVLDEMNEQQQQNYKIGRNIFLLTFFVIFDAGEKIQSNEFCVSSRLLIAG